MPVRAGAFRERVCTAAVGVGVGHWDRWKGEHFKGGQAQGKGEQVTVTHP